MFLPKTGDKTLYHDLTDSEWEKVKEKLPKEKTKGRPQIME